MIQIKLERIGDDTWANLELGRRMVNDVLPGAGEVAIGAWPQRAWCAEITGLDQRYGFERRFLSPNVSYIDANSIGSRGVFAYYNLREGQIYEVSSPLSWKRTDRYFCRVDGSSLVRMSRKEVDEWLKNHSG